MASAREGRSETVGGGYQDGIEEAGASMEAIEADEERERQASTQTECGRVRRWIR